VVKRNSLRRLKAPIMFDFLKKWKKPAEELVVEDFEPPKPPPKYVEISEEDIQPLMELYQKLNNGQLMLGQILIEHERKKTKILSEFDDLRDAIQGEIDKLRASHGIPEDDDNYSLNLPTKNQKIACFIREPEQELAETEQKERDPLK